MLAILRILFGFALFVVFGKAVEVAGPAPQTEGTTDAGYLAIAVVIGIANAVVWAPWVGRWMAEPLTGAFTSGHPADFTNHTLQLAHKLALRRWRRLALFFAFAEGVRHPDLPGAFVLGLNQSKPGSWLEKVFAREVWRFENAENCLRAWKVLSRHGVEPDLHPKAEVNLLLLSQRREVPPPASVLPVPQAPPAPKPVRNPSIRIFKGADSGVGLGTAAGGVRAEAGGAPAEVSSAGPGESSLRGVSSSLEAPIQCGLLESSVRPAPGPQEAADRIGTELRSGSEEERAGGRRKLGWRARLKVLWTGDVEN